MIPDINLAALYNTGPVCGVSVGHSLMLIGIETPACAGNPDRVNHKDVPGHVHTVAAATAIVLVHAQSPQHPHQHQVGPHIYCLFCCTSAA